MCNNDTEDKKYCYNMVVPDFLRPGLCGIENNVRRWFTPQTARRGPEIYETLEHAELEAAKCVYEYAKKELLWAKECGMIIYKNDGRKKFVLSGIIEQKTEESQIIFDKEHKTVGNCIYTAYGLVHSYPIATPYIYANELSLPDYYLSLDGFGEPKKPIIMYLVTNVGKNGTLIKFTPPDSTLIKWAIETVISEATKLLVSKGNKHPTREQIEKQIDRLPRSTKIEILKSIVRHDHIVENRGILEKKFIKDNEKWESLDPNVILWDHSNDTNIRVSDNINSSGQMYLIGVDKNCLLNEETFDLRMSTNVAIVEGMEAIDRGMFAGFTNLTTVTIPSSVVFIGQKAFKGCCELKKLNFTGDNNVKYVGLDAFKGTNIQFSDKKWVEDVRNARKIVIPIGVKNIMDYAFNGYDKLENVTIPSSVISIGDYAFYGCTALTSVTIPKNVTFIGEHAFYGCTNLKTVTFMNNQPPTVGHNAFGRCQYKNVLLVPVGSIETYKSNEKLKNKFTAYDNHYER